MFIRGLCYTSAAGLFGYFYESEKLPNFLIESPLTNKIRIGSRCIIMGEPFVRQQLKIDRDIAKKLTERQWRLIELIKQAKEELTDIDYISVHFDDATEENGTHGRVRAISSRQNKSALVHISNDHLLQEDELEGVVYHAIATIKDHDYAKSTTVEQLAEKAPMLIKLDYSVCALLWAFNMKRHLPKMKFFQNEALNISTTIATLMVISEYAGMLTVTPYQRHMTFAADTTTARLGKGDSLAKYLTRCQEENPAHDVDDRFAAIKTSEINYGARLDNLYSAVGRKV